MNEQNTQQNKTPEKEATPERQLGQIRQRNPRLVIGGLDYFDLLMEQDEQQ